MNHKSAINWDYLAQAKRLQEKLQQYFGLVEQVRALEEDPELQAALGGLMGGAVPSRAEPAELPSPPAQPGLLKTASMVPAEKRRGRGDGDRLLAFAQEGEQFDGRLLLSRAAEGGDPDLARRVSPKQANDHLRRFAQAGKVRLVTPGKRGHAGAMPVYELVTKGTSAAVIASALANIDSAAFGEENPLERMKEVFTKL